MTAGDFDKILRDVGSRETACSRGVVGESSPNLRSPECCNAAGTIGILVRMKSKDIDNPSRRKGGVCRSPVDTLREYTDRDLDGPLALSGLASQREGWSARCRGVKPFRRGCLSGVRRPDVYHPSTRVIFLWSAADFARIAPCHRWPDRGMTELALSRCLTEGACIALR